MAFVKVKGDLIKDQAVTADMLGGDVPLGGPKISNVSVSDASYDITETQTVSTSGGYIVVTGANFASGAQILVQQNNSVSTTFVNSTTLHAEVDSAAAGTYNVYVVNSDGGTAIRVNGITYA